MQEDHPLDDLGIWWVSARTEGHARMAFVQSMPKGIHEQSTTAG